MYLYTTTHNSKVWMTSYTPLLQIPYSFPPLYSQFTRCWEYIKGRGGSTICSKNEYVILMVLFSSSIRDIWCKITTRGLLEYLTKGNPALHTLSLDPPLDGAVHMYIYKQECNWCQTTIANSTNAFRRVHPLNGGNKISIYLQIDAQFAKFLPK